jgi:PAS domain S-box-containing protein
MSGREYDGHRRKFNLATQGLALAATAVCLTVFVGWISGSLLLASFNTDYVPTAPSTALLLGLLGIAVFLRGHFPFARGTRIPGLAVGSLGVLAGLLLFSLSFARVYSPIEHLGIPITGTHQGVPIGHMAPLTAALCVLIALSFLAVLTSSADRRGRAVVGFALSSMLTLIAAGLLIAYLLGTPLMYGEGFIPPALPTSLTIWLLALSIMILAGQQAWPPADVATDGARSLYGWVLVFILLSSGILFTGFLYNRHLERQHRTEIDNLLTSVADLKVNELRQWREERLGDASLFYRNPGFSGVIDRFFRAPGAVHSRVEVLTWFRKMRDAYQYDRLSLLDSSLAERIADPEASEPPDALCLRNAAVARSTDALVFQDFSRDKHSDRVYLRILVPIRDTRDTARVTAVVILRIDPEKFLYPLLKRWPTPSRTAETLIVRREGNEVLFLNGLRFDSDAALNLRVPLGTTGMPAVRAALGDTGIVEGTDYRGVPVIAEVRPVSGSPWFLVTRMDLSEVYGILSEHLWMTALSLCVMLIGTGLGVGIAWRHRRARFYRDRYMAERERTWLHDVIARSLNEIFVFDPVTLRFIFANAGAQRNLGYSMEELSALTPLDIKPQYTEEKFRAMVAPLLDGRQSLLVFETPHRRKDGSLYPAEVHLQLVDRPEGAVVLAIVNDIAERRRAEEQIHRLNRVYAVLSSINQTIIRITDHRQLLDDACRIAVDLGQFSMAWIGMWNRDTGNVEVVSSMSAHGKALVPGGVNLRDDRHRQGPTARAILTGAHALSNDIENDPSMLPWRDEARARGFQSLIAFPLTVFGETRGAFSLYSSEREFFDAAEIALLDEMARDISFAIEFQHKESERKRLQETSSERERRLYQLFDEAPVGYHELDGQGRIIAINRTELDLLGYTEEEMLHHPVWEFIVEGDQSRASVAAKMAGSLSADLAYERIFWKKDGTPLPVLLMDRPLRNDAGEITGIRSTLQDISERKKAERQLRLLAHTVASARDCISITTLDNKFIFVNEAFRTTYGYTTVELLGQDLSMLRAQGSPADLTEQILRDTLRGGWHGELLNRRKDGTEFPLELWTSMVRDEAGVPVALVGVARNITERRKVEEHLRQSEEQFRLIAENVADMIAVLDLEGNRIYNSPSYEGILGNPESLRGTASFREIHPEDRERVQEVFRETARTGKGQRIEYRLVRKDGSIRTIESKGSASRDDRGNISRVIVVSRDVTEERRLAAQFLRAQRMESIGTLAGGIAHDLNNVLAPIMMSIENLRGKSTDPKAERILDTIATSTKRGSDIVKQVLAFGRGVTGDRIHVQLRHVINEVAKIAGETFPKSISLITDVPWDIWMVSADPTQMHQVFLNMLVNARDAMPDGGRLTITAKNIRVDEPFARMNIQAKPGSYVSIAIADTGTGIPADIREKIFEPFFTTKEIGVGTGLGLSTTLGIVRSHGGFINFYSEPGKGTTFNVYIPAAGEASGAAPAAEEVDLPTGNGELVLIIDDEEAIREITRETLQAYGYRTVTARDGAQGLVIFAEQMNAIDVVITDIMMPVMDGTDAIVELRKMRPDVKIIAASGLTPKGASSTPENPGVKAFLMKPYTAETLLKTLASVLT